MKLHLQWDHAQGRLNDDGLAKWQLQFSVHAHDHCRCHAKDPYLEQGACGLRECMYGSAALTGHLACRE